jgi:hypothetical protein
MAWIRQPSTISSTPFRHAELVEPQVVRDSDLSDRNDLPVLGRAWWSLNRFPVGTIA